MSERVLTELGVHTCGDIFTHRGTLSAMDSYHHVHHASSKALAVGVGGLEGLLEAYLGLSSNVVEPPSREGRKSIGVETYV